MKFPLKSVFGKTNHGPVAPEEERDVEQKGVIKYLRQERVSSYNQSYRPVSMVKLPEAALYRVQHTMKRELYDSDGVFLSRDWIGVMIN